MVKGLICLYETFTNIIWSNIAQTLSEKWFCLSNVPLYKNSKPKKHQKTSRHKGVFAT